jgi:hypothetical protein
MMLGSIEYLENWVYPLTEGNMSFTSLNFIMLMIFVFLMPILLINLLVSPRQHSVISSKGHSPPSPLSL